uniref:TPM domain-containing protein n=1 Tax=Acrobeloides nanus TaxID=290746 RepID=A0A914CU25_9BILA
MVMLVATEDHKFWAARGDKFPFTGPEITAIFMQQKKSFASGDYAQALENILDSIINKNMQLSTGDTTINQPETTTELMYTSKTEPEQKSPWETISISPTVLIILIIVVILLIVCCVCCCIVSKMSNICSGRGSSSYDVENRRNYANSHPTYVNSYPTYVNSNPTPAFDQGGGGDFSSSSGGDKGGGGDFSSSSGGDKGGGGDFSSSSGGDKGGGGDFSSSSGGDKGGGGGGDFSSSGGGDKGGGGGW